MRELWAEKVGRPERETPRDIGAERGTEGPLGIHVRALGRTEVPKQ